MPRERRDVRRRGDRGAPASPLPGRAAADRVDRVVKEPRIVFTVAVAVFAPALDGPWLFDDHGLIVENPFVHGFSHWTRWFTHSFWSTSWAEEPEADARNFGRPFVLASYVLD